VNPISRLAEYRKQSLKEAPMDANPVIEMLGRPLLMFPYQIRFR